jgi:hypothetical protein
MASNPACLAGSWKVSFAVHQDPSTFFDGVLNLWANNWLVIMDHRGSAVEGRFLKSDDSIVVGSVVNLSLHWVWILSISPPEVRQFSDPAPGPSVPVFGPTKCWKITYSTNKDLDRGRMKAYDGSLELSEKDSWLVLKNAKSQQIGCRYLNKGENWSELVISLSLLLSH